MTERLYLKETFTPSEAESIDPYPMGCMDGVVVVEMIPQSETRNGLYLPGDEKTKLRLDYAFVVASGDPEYSVGECVVVHPYFGKCVSGFGFDDVIGKDETRFYGLNGGPGSDVDFSKYPLWKAVPMSWDLKPKGKQVLLELVPREEEQNGIFIPMNQQKRDPVATVVDVGPRVEELKPGMKVVYHANALIGLDGISKDLAICEEDQIYGYCTS